MDKEKEIDKIKKDMCGDYAPYCGCGCRTQHCEIETFAKNLIEAGYGNVKQAVKEFAEQLKLQFTKGNYHILAIRDKIDKLTETICGDYN